MSPPRQFLVVRPILLDGRIVPRGEVATIPGPLYPRLAALGHIAALDDTAALERATREDDAARAAAAHRRPRANWTGPLVEPVGDIPDGHRRGFRT